jgi:hypothetical protein
VGVDLQLYDVYSDGNFYDIGDETLGKIRGTTNFIVAPKDQIADSVKLNHCLVLEIKPTKRMEADSKK